MGTVVEGRLYSKIRTDSYKEYWLDAVEHQPERNVTCQSSLYSGRLQCMVTWQETLIRSGKP